MLRTLFMLLLYMLASWYVAASDDAEYDALLQELTRSQHRQVGSAEQEQAFQAVKTYLENKGLEPKVQTFPVVRRTVDFLKFEVGGQAVEGVGVVDNGVATWVMDEPETLRTVFGKSGSLADLRGVDVDGALVVLDLDEDNVSVDHVFQRGARAVLWVSAGEMGIWELVHLNFPGPATVPMLYLDKEAAQAAGLLADNQVEMQVKTRVADFTGKNLWLHIGSDVDDVMNMGVPESIVLSASLDSIGLVPDNAPDVRYAANAALLARVAVSLQEAADKNRLKRSVFILFNGSRNFGQEGARYFHYGLRHARMERKETHQLTNRLERLIAERARLEEPIAACDRLDLFSSDDVVARRTMFPLIKRELAAYASSLNARIRDDRIEIDRIRKSGKEAELAQRIAFLNERVEGNNAEKAKWNGLRKDLMNRQLRDNANAKDAYAALMSALKAELTSYATYLDELRVHMQSWVVLMESAQIQDASGATSPRVILGHTDFDLASSEQAWAFSIAGNMDFIGYGKVGLGNYQRALGTVLRIAEKQSWPDEVGRPFTPAFKPFFKPSSLSQPWVRSVPSTVGLLNKAGAYQLISIGGGFEKDGLPIRSTVNLGAMVAPMSNLFVGIASSEKVSQRSPAPDISLDPALAYSYKGNGGFVGRQFINYSNGSQEKEGPANDAILLFESGSKAREPRLPGYVYEPVARINANGYAFLPMVSAEVSRARGGSDMATLWGVGYGPDQRLNRISVGDDSKGIQKSVIPLFYLHGGAVFSWGFRGDQQEQSSVIESGHLEAGTDSPPTTKSYVNWGRLPTFFKDKKGPVKFLGGHGEIALGGTEQEPEGVGIPNDAKSMLNLDPNRQQAWDFFHLNEKRLDALRQRNIINDTLESLQADVRDLLERAAVAEEANEHEEANSLHTYAAALGFRIHRPVKGITQDLVQAVVVLLLLNIPFAFAMERMIFGFTSIYKQVLGFVGFFVGTFAILFVTHPAFALASAPVVIFLAFVIILLSAITVGIVMGKIKQEIKAIQGLASVAHGVESDNNTAMAAVLIGISGMRNRPLKTFLTALTVVLLTFTILVFASFSAELGVVKTFLGQDTGPSRIEMHRHSYLTIQKSVLDAVVAQESDEYTIVQRGGIFMNPTKRYSHTSPGALSNLIVVRPNSNSMAVFQSMLGLDPTELSVNTEIARVLPGFGEATRSGDPGLFLSEEGLEKLGAEIGDMVQLLGDSFEIQGTFSSSEMRGLSSIEGNRIVPPNFTQIVNKVGAKKGSMQVDVKLLEQVDVSQLEWAEADTMLVANIHDLKRKYGAVTMINLLAMYPKSADVDIDEGASRMSELFDGAVHAKDAEGAIRYFFTKAVAGSGFNDVLVPLLLGGLIIFSSLMGSIVDREKEIFTYSALGLSPPDVGMLFFAESAVYSVVGGMGGYLLSQLFAKILSLLGAMGLVQAPAMNFSSLSSVLTILVVMAVVMLSTIVPAIKAGKSANPGVSRKWRMPSPDGNTLKFVFPFTVSEVDFKGILSFIAEHFENHSDATLGNFAAREVRLFEGQVGAGARMTRGIEAEVSLAPFDLGIFQNFKMYSQEFDMPGIDEVVVEIERVGGTPGAWMRGNINFADELRQQFLLWRSLPIDTVEHYRKQTDDVLKGGA